MLQEALVTDLVCLFPIAELFCFDYYVNKKTTLNIVRIHLDTKTMHLTQLMAREVVLSYQLSKFTDVIGKSAI